MSLSTDRRTKRPAGESDTSLFSAPEAVFPEYLLIVAGSGRSLAEASARAGMKPLVVDLFGDADMRNSAIDSITVPALDAAHLMASVEYFVRHYPVRHLVYGSGIEPHPESLGDLDGRIRILGNSPETFIRLQNKVEFFSVLSELNIPFPEVVFTAPPEKDGRWLVKPRQGQGGFGIRRYGPDCPAPSSVYWQRFEPGTSHSVLFLANGQEARIVGFNTQWTVALPPDQEFVFAGIVNDCPLSGGQRSAIMGWLSRCVPVFGLKGINSLDFVKSGDRLLVLEINARPSASMQLYDGMLSGHVLAAQGRFPDKLPERSGVRGMQIVYAESDWVVPAGFEWPEGCVDRPAEGGLCRKGQPVCSIIAHQNDSQQVVDLLKLRQQIVNNMIKVQSHGIQSKR
ncbi:ATP-grasp domain-containing protein [Methylosarcina fibrata]|uniref:ATP-grasp domain-containing protein n=1 Tax=Methylosarcina fibrata TaxID=105972 RepID=UPI0003651A29|nr:ATP-grasp domain-containing protein [Methylosarcina fibrata]